MRCRMHQIVYYVSEAVERLQMTDVEAGGMTAFNLAGACVVPEKVLFSSLLTIQIGNNKLIIIIYHHEFSFYKDEII